VSNLTLDIIADSVSLRRSLTFIPIGRSSALSVCVVILLPRTYWRRRRRLDLLLQWFRSSVRSVRSFLSQLIAAGSAPKRWMTPLLAGRPKRR